MHGIFSHHQCTLGEGPLWHPERQQLFWFDIVEKQLMSAKNNESMVWQFDEHVSAAGWTDTDSLLIASETELFEFNIETQAYRTVCALEADTPTTRSNDGRADPQGGFWIGTMGKSAEAEAGSIYRYYRGELRRIFAKITITNAICFAPDGKTAYFADTSEQTIQRVGLDSEGWPSGTAEVFIDLRPEGINPDGAVVDSTGCLWNAQWGAHRVARYSPEGEFLDAIAFDAKQVSCPAFGGPDLSTLFVTSAAIGQTGEADGLTYYAETQATGQPEHRVVL